MNGERQAWQPGRVYVWLKALVRKVLSMCSGRGDKEGRRGEWWCGRLGKAALDEARGWAAPFLKLHHASTLCQTPEHSPASYGGRDVIIKATSCQYS